MRLRTDIQALRGLAILLVLLYHADLGFFAAGYLGVDIFFVISGFLITRIVRDGIEAGNFSFAEFYFRRAKRLLPAAYVTFLVTTVLCLFVLAPSDLEDYAAQLAGAITFSANFVFWEQADYFATAAEFKPLLHVWSLAVEEQYYLLLPAAMVFSLRRHWLRGAVCILIISFSLCLLLAVFDPAGAFYLLPTRAWELAIGSIASLTVLDGPRHAKVLNYAFWPALICLVLVPIVPLGTLHPGADALIVCIATLVVILRRHAWTNSGRSFALLGKVGDCSYALYLVHWPIFALMNNAYAGEAPPAAHLSCLGLSVIAGYLLYRYIELPVRRSDLRPTRRLIGATVATSFALIFISLSAMWLSNSGIDYAHIRRSNYGFGSACKFRDHFTPLPECRDSPSPAVLVWGDSFAMHLVPGIVATTDKGVLQAARSLCGPFLGLAPVDHDRVNMLWAESCIRFNQSVLDYAAATPSIDVIVLSSAFLPYLDAARGGRHWRHAINLRGELIERPIDEDTAVAAMNNTVKAIRAAGKRVVIVAPPPASGFDVGGCLERKAAGKLLLGRSSNCELILSEVEKHQRAVRKFLQRVATDANVAVIDFRESLCDERICASEMDDGTFIYMDTGHFSYAGSRRVAEKMGLGGLIGALAR